MRRAIRASFLLFLSAEASAFSQPRCSTRRATSRLSAHDQTTKNASASAVERRDVLVAWTVASSVLLLPTAASAGIDVSGIRVEGSNSVAGGGSNIKEQLKAYDGSGSRRVEEIRAVSSSSAAAIKPTATAPVAPPGVATWALRASEPTYRKLNLGTINRYEGQLVSPKGPMARGISVSFDFPSDWLQLDRANGCVQYVDQRNGDKLYWLRATLPDDASSLSSAPKSFFANAIFDPQGSLVKFGGLTVEDYKASGDKLTECPNNACAPHRRLKLKFATVTGNGLRVERRGLVDAYQVEGDVYMLVTSSNAVKFEKGGIERDTVEAIVDSFRIDV